MDDPISESVTIDNMNVDTEGNDLGGLMSAIQNKSKGKKKEDSFEEPPVEEGEVRLKSKKEKEREKKERQKAAAKEKKARTSQAAAVSTSPSENLDDKISHSKQDSNSTTKDDIDPEEEIGIS